jgi:phage terminase large subunit-like protein
MSFDLVPETGATAIGTEQALIDLLFDWKTWARDDQLEPPGDWFIWLAQAGRGWGKTRVGAENIRHRIDSGIWKVVNVAGPTWTDVVDTMVVGTDDAPGLLGVWPPSRRPVFVRDEKNPHLKCWNGAMIRLRAAKSAERFRGPQADGGWLDEVDAWSPDKMTAVEAFELFELGIRLGPDPRIIVTSTPKPRGIVRELRKRDDCVVTRGSTRDNRANLAPKFLAMLERRYKGTRVGAQEVEGELLEDTPGAIWTTELLERTRVAEAPDLVRHVVAVDPAASAKPDSDSTGIIVAAKGVDLDGYLLADRSCKLSPLGWGQRAVDAFHEFEADLVVAEVNNGGDMVETILRTIDPEIPVKKIHAKKAKHLRAEPVAALYEQGRAHHVGRFPELEAELCGFTPDGYTGEGSPDRADAAVYALRELLLGDWAFEDLPDVTPEEFEAAMVAEPDPDLVAVLTAFEDGDD